MRPREYTGPLGILAAGALGLSLLCSVSAMAMGDLSRYIPITLEPLSLVDLAISNFETAAALTQQSVTEFVPTQTATLVPPSNTASLTLQPTDTPRRFVTITPQPPRRTRLAPTAVVVASRTPIAPSRTPVPTRTPTRVPTRTNTPIPPTSTPIPPTNTPVPPTLPPPTDTPLPPPTPVPPTDTSAPPPTTEPQDPTAEPTTADIPATPAEPGGNPSSTPGP